MVKVEIFNSWGFVSRGWGLEKIRKKKCEKTTGILHKKVIGSGVIFVQYVEDKKFKIFSKKGLTNTLFYDRICLQG